MLRSQSFASLACFVLAGVLAWGITNSTFAQPKVEPLVSGLHLPLGITTDYTRKVIYVAEGGEGRILRIEGDKTIPVVVGFPRGVAGPANSFQVGPTAIRVVSNMSVASVASLDVGDPKGWDSIAIHLLPEPNKPAVEYAASTARLGPMAPRTASRPAGGFGALSNGIFALVFTSTGDEAQGMIYRSLMTNNKWNAPTRFVATRDLVGVGIPSALLTTSRGEVLVGQAGSLEQAGDSLISYYQMGTGRLLLNQSTGLHDIVAVAQSPATDQLYALDLAWARPADAGLYQIISEFKQGRLGVTTKKIVSLPRPVDMTFAPDGRLLVTVLGPADADPKTSGQVLAIGGGL